VDGIDLEILRRMTQHSDVGGAGLDPRISARQISAKVKVSPATVKARWRRWTQEGFVQSWVCEPNLRLFGVEALVQRVVLPGPQGVPQLLNELDDVDGLIAVRTGFHEGFDGVYIHGISLQTVRDHPSAVARRQRLLRRLVPEGHFEAPIPMEYRPCNLDHPSGLDWRIIQALLEQPHLSPRALGIRLKVSWKTAVRHYNRLFDSGALLFGPVLDRSRFPGITLAIVYQDPQSRDEIFHHLETRFRYYAPWDRWTLFPDLLIGDPNVLRVTVPVRTPAEADIITGEIRSWNGVVRALRVQLTGGREYLQWMRQRVDEKVAEAAARPGPKRRRPA